MRTAAFFLAFFIISIKSNAQDSTSMQYTKASDGSEYMIYPAVNGAKVVTGNFIELNTVAKYKDSVLGSSVEDGMPQYALYDTANFPVPFKEVFTNIHVGDSICLKLSTDSIISKGQAPPFLKAGDFIYQYYVISNVYLTNQATDSAQKTHVAEAKIRAQKKQLAIIAQSMVENKAQIEADSKLIEAYLAKNNLKATRGQWGTYIVTKKAGTGKKITDADIVAVNYTGKAFGTNKVFDSNTDPKFKHVEPYDVNMGSFSGLILGWFDALFQMQKGTVATIYIPSSLGYGAAGREPEIAPNTILVFDMSPVKVRTEAEMMVEAATKVPKVAQAKSPVKKIPVQKKTLTVKPKSKTKAAGK